MSLFLISFASFQKKAYKDSTYINKESWEECERRVHSMLKERLDIENVEIERAHRAGRKSRNKPRTIVCKTLPI